MTTRVLFADPKKCTGCRLCEIACSLQHAGVSNPARSRIRVINWKNRDVFLPVSCQHCEDPPCLAACPKEAIYREDELGSVAIDLGKCVGCTSCVFACPYGAMGFDQDRGRARKCDLCEGDPVCVRFCEPGALNFKDASTVQYPRSRSMALKFTIGKVRRG
ncbi:MAG: 4Fe-4S dicluster domain-containing protein [Desulfobacterales bacterium]|nr:4Fe-4S dicluster domain-containing protein [Desulfobacterales bacterium]